MSAAAIRTPEYTARRTTLFVSLELGEKDWKFALATGLDEPPRHGQVRPEMPTDWSRSCETPSNAAERTAS